MDKYPFLCFPATKEACKKFRIIFFITKKVLLIMAGFVRVDSKTGRLNIQHVFPGKSKSVTQSAFRVWLCIYCPCAVFDSPSNSLLQWPHDKAHHVLL